MFEGCVRHDAGWLWRGMSTVIFHRQRGEARTRIAVAARLSVGPYTCDTMLLNASTGGVLAALDHPPVRGTPVTLHVGEWTLSGQVRWRGIDCCGIALREPIRVSDLIEGHAELSTRMPEPRALRGLSGLLRVLVGERIPLRNH